MKSSLATATSACSSCDLVQPAGDGLSIAPALLQKLEKLLYVGPLNGLRPRHFRQSARSIIRQVDRREEPNNIWSLVRELMSNFHEVLEGIRNLHCLKSFVNGFPLVPIRPEKVQELDAEDCFLQLGIGKRCSDQCPRILLPSFSQYLLSLLPSGDSCRGDNRGNAPYCLGPSGEINWFQLGTASPSVEHGPARKDPETKGKSTQDKYVGLGQLAVCHDIAHI